MKSIFFLFSVFFSISAVPQREISSIKTTKTIVIDGLLNETDWELCNWSTGFTQLKPFPGEKPSKPTEVAILYDQEAVYFGVKCFDHPDSVSKVLFNSFKSLKRSVILLSKKFILFL